MKEKKTVWKNLSSDIILCNIQRDEKGETIEIQMKAHKTNQFDYARPKSIYTHKIHSLCRKLKE